MIIFIYILVSAALLGIFYQDLSSRKIHIGLPVLLMGSLIGLSYYNGFFDVQSMVDILVFIALNMIGVTLYFSLKNKKFVNPLSSYIGLGDILFLVAIVPLFILKSYMLFFITGMIFSLLLYIIFKKRLNFESIPLAGYLSAYLGILLFINSLTVGNLFRTLYF